MTTTPFSVAGRRAVVVGAGRSGTAAAALLARRGAEVTLADSGAGTPDAGGALAALGVRFETGPHRAELFASADLLVLSPGVPPTQAAVAAAVRRGVPVVGEIELASRWLAGRMVAITGTKGKSTTTTLTARMLQEGGWQATAGGNLGTALSAQVDDSRPESLHVVEVSSFQLETTDTFHPWIAVLLNFSPDHLDRHASLDEYAQAKTRIFRNQDETDWAVVNAGDRAALELARGARARRCDFAVDAPVVDGVTVEDGHIVRRTGQAVTPLVPLSSVRLAGRHLLSDVLAATAVSAIAGVSPSAMQRAVEAFEGLEHALEPVGEIDGVRFVNDSKATNIVAARNAIESFDAPLVVIMGGRYKGGRFEDLRDAVRDRVTAIVAIGEASSRVAAALGDLAGVHPAASMTDAVRLGRDLAKGSATVLLAPACSSFDMFADYAARGRAFKAEVDRLRRERVHEAAKKVD